MLEKHFIMVSLITYILNKWLCMVKECWYAICTKTWIYINL